MSNGPKDTALWRHVNDVYSHMARDAEDVTINDRPARVWEGFATHLLPQLGVSMGYYGKVLKYLQVMGSVNCIKRGSKNVSSQWQVIKPPTEEDFMRAKPHVEKGRPRDLAEIERQLKDLRDLIPNFDVPSAIAGLKKELDVTKKEVRALKRQVKVLEERDG